MPTLDLIPLASSVIAAIGYDPQTSECLVEFTSGSVFIYEDFPQQKFDEWATSDSPGRFFNSQVKNIHPYRRVTPPASLVRRSR